MEQIGENERKMEKKGCQVVDSYINLTLKWYKNATTLPVPRKVVFGMARNGENGRKMAIQAGKWSCG
jgi:hypothetical protein